MIKKLIKQASGTLTSEHYKKIGKFSLENITDNNVIDYIIENKLSKKIINDSMSDIRKFLRKKPMYSSYIRDIEKKINYI